MISFNQDPVVTDSLRHWRGREVFPTDMGSADLRGLSSELHLRSVFSARTTSADYLQEVGTVLDDMLAGKFNVAEGRFRLMKKLKQLGYDPTVGFPQDMADVPPAEKGSLQDLSSEQRIDLMLKTNLALARNYGRLQAGNTELARYAWPAWEMVRVEPRHTPRGERRDGDGAAKPDPEHGWPRRWEHAGESEDWHGVSRTAFAGGRMVARKDSPIWQALANGEGGYTDTLGHPFPPFAFNSGMDWRAIKRAEWLTLKGESRNEKVENEQTPAKVVATLAPSTGEVTQLLERMSPDLREALKRRLAA